MEAKSSAETVPSRGSLIESGIAFSLGFIAGYKGLPWCMHLVYLGTITGLVVALVK